MAIFTLKTIRFFVPAILVYMLAVLFCWVSDWCSLAVPESYETFAKSIIAAALGAIYYESASDEHLSDYFLITI